jgi:HAMP domain-containing protein/CheY-like chemotaxis protein
MMRTIKQRIYWLGLLPLALLSVALIAFNGAARIDEAQGELRNAQKLTAELLRNPAIEALVVGNDLAFEQTTNELLNASSSVACISLADATHHVISQRGNCDHARNEIDSFAITTPATGLSDFDAGANTARVGELTILMNDAGLLEKRRQIGIQLVFSLLLVAAVLGITGRLLRARLVEPVQSISAAMAALSDGNYDTRVPVDGKDELANLGRSINETVGKVAAYTRELERRRSEADRALQEADDIALARDALVHSLTEDLDAPLRLMHAELTSAALANTDPALKGRIKEALTLLQGARANFTDLMEIAISRRLQPKPHDDLAEIISDLERDVRQFSQSVNIPVSFTVTQHHRNDGSASKLLIDIDSVRLRKAIFYVTRALARNCDGQGIYIDSQVILTSANQLHVAFTLRAFYDPVRERSILAESGNLGAEQFGQVPPAMLGWTDREIRVIDYLLRSAGIVPTFAISQSRCVSVYLETTCNLGSESGGRGSGQGRLARPVIALVVSDDLSLTRLTTRGDLSNIEFKVISYPRVHASLGIVASNDILLIDISKDVADALALLEHLAAEGVAVPNLVAICPPGRVSDSLSTRLFELGFTGIIQKPVQYSRLVEVIEATLAQLPRSSSVHSPNSNS